MLADPIGADTLDTGLWAIWGDLASKHKRQKSIEHVDHRSTIISMTQGAIKTASGMANIEKRQSLAFGRILIRKRDGRHIMAMRKAPPGLPADQSDQTVPYRP